MTTYRNVHEDLELIGRAAEGIGAASVDEALGVLLRTVGALAREVQRLRAEIVDINDEIGSVPPDGLTS